MNSITIAGQLGRDAELRNLPDGTPVCVFSVADSQGRDKPTIWWRAQLFGKRAESLHQYLTNGQSVTITGNVTEREWKDKDGTPKKSMDVRVQDVALQGGRRDADTRAAEPEQPSKPKPTKPAAGSGFDDMDSDIPF